MTRQERIEVYKLAYGAYRLTAPACAEITYIGGDLRRAMDVLETLLAGNRKAPPFDLVSGVRDPCSWNASTRTKLRHVEELARKALSLVESADRTYGDEKVFDCLKDAVWDIEGAWDDLGFEEKCDDEKGAEGASEGASGCGERL